MKAQFKYFVIILLSAFMALSAVVISFNVAVDPFDVYRLVRKKGFNQIKPVYRDYTRLAKVIQIERFPETNMALGSSRTQYGVDMMHPFWGNQPRKTGWNMAVSGAHMYEVARLFDHAVAVAGVKKVLIGLDFFMFNALTAGHFDDESYFSVDDGGDRKPLHRLKQLALTLITTDAVRASFETLRKQKSRENRFDIYGRMLSSRERNKILRNEGFEDNFLKNEAAYARQTWTPCANNAFSFRRKGDNSPLGRLANLLKKANANNIDVILFISPSHARLWETLDGTGLWEKFELWKIELARLLEVTEKETGNSFKLWDFSGFNKFSTEPVPKGKAKSMKWYLDPSHYSVELGRLMLEVISGEQSATDNGDVFGRELNATTVARVLKEIRSEKKVFEKHFPELIKSLYDRAAEQLAEREKEGTECLLF